MTASRVRVRPPHSHGGLLVLALAVGAVMAIPVAAYVWYWHAIPNAFRPFGYQIWIINALQAAIAFIPFLTFLIWLLRQCQHARWVAAVGASYALALTVIAVLGVDLYLPYEAWDQPLEFLLLFPIAIVLGALLALAALFVHRRFFHRVIEQDGSLCNHCGYPAGRSQSAHCPECGEPLGSVPLTRSDQVIALCHRRKRLVLAVLALMLIAGYALIAKVEYEHRTLGRTFGPEWTYVQRAYDPRFGPLGTAIYRDADYEGDRMVIVLAMQRHPVWRHPELHVRVGETESFPPSSWIVVGTHSIYSQVPPAQVRNVLRNGPPQELMNRLVDAAREAGWQHVDRQAPWRMVPEIEVPWDEVE